MTKTIEEIKEKVTPILKEEGVIRSSLFGSIVRDEERADSDIDMLVELPAGRTLLDLIRLEHKLEDSLGQEVDLGMYDALHRRLKDRILAEQVPIYEQRI
ncbi:MAG: hypothetical protein A3H70_02380 [Candidatus Komeilibacteria bacterium RIFCSPLOWO2_02_FULL_48_11]|uniref:Polymerase beta nucleotidyltransferase domain-containing protein n=1 Tax=Candidatus Komeilibacteria bacterium RIFCSPLOWO2_02_FULL_48_11 TaxID=1798553 RepID=A0A1G2BUT0_9BACT|nr:MAG: hypothetical protein A3H70_02380 [Candidatus Komeilibacteria bacterium RIFCSPLOWO2_02_FULL_48_11]